MCVGVVFSSNLRSLLVLGASRNAIFSGILGHIISKMSCPWLWFAWVEFFC